MSVDYCAYAVMGCEVPVGLLHKIVTVEHKEHNWPQDAKFCPVCGRETRVPESEPIYNEDGTIGKFSLIWSTDEERAFVGLAASGDSYGYAKDDFMKLPDIEALESELAATLGPLGLWDSDKFGLYSVLRCSY